MCYSFEAENTTANPKEIDCFGLFFFSLLRELVMMQFVVVGTYMRGELGAVEEMLRAYGGVSVRSFIALSATAMAEMCGGGR